MLLVAAVVAPVSAGAGADRAPTDSPPTSPTIRWSVDSGASDPSIGDGVTVVFNSTFVPGYYGSSFGSFLVWIFYAPPGFPSGEEPTDCGNEWVTTGCSNGEVYSAVETSPQAWSGETAFTVDPPTGSSEVYVAVSAVSNTAQGSGTSEAVIPISPSTGSPAPDAGSGSGGSSPSSNLSWTWVAAFAILALAVALAVLASRAGRRRARRGAPVSSGSLADVTGPSSFCARCGNPRASSGPYCPGCGGPLE